jgi:hypothetical protein
MGKDSIMVNHGQWIEGVPAYGKDYPNIKAVKAAWNSGADFRRTDTGQYFNKQDAVGLGYSVNIRYNNLKKVVHVL